MPQYYLHYGFYSLRRNFTGHVGDIDVTQALTTQFLLLE